MPGLTNTDWPACATLSALVIVLNGSAALPTFESSPAVLTDQRATLQTQSVPAVESLAPEQPPKESFGTMLLYPQADQVQVFPSGSVVLNAPVPAQTRIGCPARHVADRVVPRVAKQLLVLQP